MVASDLAAVATVVVAARRASLASGGDGSAHRAPFQRLSRQVRFSSSGGPVR